MDPLRRPGRYGKLTDPSKSPQNLHFAHFFPGLAGSRMFLVMIGWPIWIYFLSWVHVFMGGARERLARLKSRLNLKLVRRYRDRSGASKIQGGPDLKQSQEYPIHLGLKAGDNHIRLCKDMVVTIYSKVTVSFHASRRSVPSSVILWLLALYSCNVAPKEFRCCPSTLFLSYPKLKLLLP